MPGLLIAFEGLDQSGKQTQAERLRAHVESRGRHARCSIFPPTRRASGRRFTQALHGEREYAADVLQLLYIANRYEQKPQIERWLGRGTSSSFAIATWRRASPTARPRGSIRCWLRRHAALPAAAGADDSARHRAGDRRPPQDRRSRSLRARPRPPVARARELSPSGGSRADGCGSTASATRMRSPRT